MTRVTPVGSMSKEDIRKEFIRRRAGIDKEEHKRRSSCAMRQIIDSEEYARCTRLLAYMPVRNEISTADLVSDVLNSGRMLYLPRVARERRELEIVRVSDISTDLAKGTFGILEPVGALGAATQAEIEQIEIAVIPGVAFDREGYRLGYGAGYFDGFLSKLSADCLTVGVCFSEQLVERLPRDPWDVPVKRVVVG